MKLSTWLFAFALSSIPWAAYSTPSDYSPWDCVQATSGFEGKWTIVQGHASVERQGGQISIKIFNSKLSDGSTSSNPLESPDETIAGTLTKDGKITAILTYLGTDANPEKIEGQLTQRTEKLSGGITFLYENIVFSRYYNLIGLARRVRQN